MTPAEPAAPSDLPQPTPASPALQSLRSLVLAQILALVVLGLLWELWLAPTGQRTLALKVLPLALALPGVLRHRLYTYRWLSLLVWLYVLEGLVRSTSERGIAVPLAALEVLLAVGLFTAATVYIRKRLRGAATAA
jgi:uncharacterized membrane protein